MLAGVARNAVLRQAGITIAAEAITAGRETVAAVSVRGFRFRWG